MSLYLSITFKFIYCFTLNILITASVSDKQSSEISGSNESLILNKNYNSNSYYYFQNGLLVSNSTPNVNLENSVNHSRKSCTHDNQCSRYEDYEAYEKCCNKKCCNKKCINNKGSSVCPGDYSSPCNRTDDCYGNPDLECISGECICKNYYKYNEEKQICADSSNYDSNTAMEIYKITMIFASCCLALILIIFLVCILRKSYCPSRRQMVPLDNSTIPDIFTLFPHVGNYDGGPLGDGTQPPFEKPPTYDETIQLMREEIGIPPPAYRGNYTPNSSNPSTPEMSSRVVITRPALITVNEDSNSPSLSSTDSSVPLNDVSVAGPSGYQGFVNRAFIDN